MPEQHEEISKLLLGYVTKSLSPDDQQKLEDWINSSDSRRAWVAQWDDLDWIAGQGYSYDHVDVDKGIENIWAKIQGSEHQGKREIRKAGFAYWLTGAAAAAVIAFGAWWLVAGKQGSKQQAPDSVVQSTNTGVKMESLLAQHHASITLYDGTTRVLDTMANGTIITQPGCTVKKENDLVTYQVDGSNAGSGFNQIVAGRGRQVQLILPDSSKAWLNTGSGIEFSIVNSAANRLVKISGEVYFEVHPNKQRPFMVTAKGTTIQALGTKFDVQAYNDEQGIKTTLMEGAIKVKTDIGDAVLDKAGQTAIVNNDNSIAVRQVKDASNIVSWKSGNFRFEHARLVDVMREIKRWYGVDIVYADTPSVYFTYTAFRRTYPLDSAIRHITQNDTRLTIRRDGNSLILSSR